MAILFMKIDTNCDGTVDWDEFCTYMLLEYQEKDTMNKGRKLPYSYPLKIIPRSAVVNGGVCAVVNGGVCGVVNGGVCVVW